MPRRALCLLALLTGVALVAIRPAGAQTNPFDTDIANAKAQVDQAEADAHAAANRLEDAKARQAQVQAQVADVQARIADLQVRIPALQAQVEQLRRVLRKRAAVLYQMTGPLSGEEALPFDPSLDARRRQRLADDVAKRDHETQHQISTAVKLLSAAKADLTAQQTQLASQQQQLAQLAQQLQDEKTVFDAKVAAANAALERARQIGALRAQGEPVMGPTVLSAAQMAAWYRSKGYSPHLATSIDDLAAIYVQEGQDEHVRGDLAFAQAIVETGGFSAAPANNYAGMGWCDSCSQGTRFPTPRDGVRAQIQHLENYADSTSRAARLAHPPSPYWYGSDPVTAALNFDTFFAKGWAPTWNDMGHGNWATDRGYAAKVLHVYADMIAFAQSH